MLEQTGNTVVPPCTPRFRNLYQTHFDVDIVVNDRNRVVCEPVIASKSTYRASAVIHECLWLYQPSRAARTHVPASNLGLKIRPVLPNKTMLLGERIQNDPTEIMTRFCVVTAGISQTDHKRDGHDSKNTRSGCLPSRHPSDRRTFTSWPARPAWPLRPVWLPQTRQQEHRPLPVPHLLWRRRRPARRRRRELHLQLARQHHRLGLLLLLLPGRFPRRVRHKKRLADPWIQETQLQELVLTPRP